MEMTETDEQEKKMKWAARSTQDVKWLNGNRIAGQAGSGGDDLNIRRGKHCGYNDISAIWHCDDARSIAM